MYPETKLLTYYEPNKKKKHFKRSITHSNEQATCEQILCYIGAEWIRCHFCDFCVQVLLQGKKWIHVSRLVFIYIRPPLVWSVKGHL